MIILATGNGKGKTTAAIGQAIRAIGQGRKVFFVQFIKSDSYPSGEDEVLRSLEGKLDFVKGGRGFVGILGDNLPLAAHQFAAQQALILAREALSTGNYGLIVLDEANVAVTLKLISEKDLLDFLSAMPEYCDVMLTGRGASKKLIRRADFVTDCLEVKHPFRKKVAARKGLEY